MAHGAHIPVSFVVEGDIDDAVVRRIAEHRGIGVHEVFVRNGKPAVIRGLPGFNNSARSRPWFVLVDLDHDAPCASAEVQTHLPHPSPLIRFRVAVRAVESWLLADRTGFAKFFGVRVAGIAAAPDAADDPKQLVVELGAGSRKRLVRNGVPPRPGSGRRTGDLYASFLIEFAREHWDIEAAIPRSRSLQKAVDRLEELGTP